MNNKQLSLYKFNAIDDRKDIQEFNLSNFDTKLNKEKWYFADSFFYTDEDIKTIKENYKT